MKRIVISTLSAVALVFWLVAPNSAHAQTSAFVYQGFLTDTNGNSLTGNYDLQFGLFSATNSGSQVGSLLTNSPVGITNGLFAVSLDFGSTSLSGNPLWLQIGVRPYRSTNSYTILYPLQPLESAPYSYRAAVADYFLGTISDSQLSANIAEFSAGGTFTGPIVLKSGSGSFSGAVTGTFSGAATGTFSGAGTGTFSGNGAGLTNVNITNLTGVVQSNFNWQLIQTTGQQAQVATDYLATNSAQTTLILPSNPNIGNSLRISGSGANGWVLAQNTGQSILTGNLGLPAGRVWNPAAASSPQFWVSLASSANGLNLVGAVANGYLFTSPDGGQTWSQRASSLEWQSVASSADGTRLVAAVKNGYIYTSVNSGTNWTLQSGSGSQEFHGVASSSDGTKLVAVVDNGYIYTSVNGGTNWTQANVPAPYYSVASSADGVNLVAVADNGYIYTSANSGVNWTQRATVQPYYSVASSASGVKLVAVAYNGYIYTSGDSGVNWIQRGIVAPYISVASSASGNCLVVVAQNNLIYSSYDGGQTWTARTTAAQAWTCVSVSGDGTRAAAGVNGAQIYSSLSATTLGTAGSLTGVQYSALELQYIGGGLWMPLSFAGTFAGF